MRDSEFRIFSCNTQTLSCSMWDLVPQSGIESRLPESGALNLSHWATREVSNNFLNGYNVNAQSDESEKIKSGTLPP